MGFVVQVYKRKMPEGTPGVDPAVQLLQKYELHRNGEVFAAGMETIQEVIDEISETCRNRYDSDEVTISSLEPKDAQLCVLTGKERIDFVKQAPLLGYEENFLPH